MMKIKLSSFHLYMRLDKYVPGTKSGNLAGGQICPRIKLHFSEPEYVRANMKSHSDQISNPSRRFEYVSI